MTTRVFVRPANTRPYTLGTANFKQTTSFAYTGTVEQYTVPSFAKHVHIWAYGAGASSTSQDFEGSNGSFVFATVKGLQSKTLLVSVGQAGGYEPDLGFCGGLDFDGLTLGGGSTTLSIAGSKPFLIAAGGGSGSDTGNGVPEESPESFQSNKISLDAAVGQSSPNASRGAGGSGLYGGLSGLHGGSAGLSLVPSRGHLISNASVLVKQKYWNSSIGLGSSGVAQHGALFIEIVI